MPTQTPALKRHNHRVHPCLDEKKGELLNLLLSKNSDKKIIVVASNPTELSSEQENVSIMSDEELLANKELVCDMLISYDLPPKAIIYMARLAHTHTYALILLNESQEKLLHPIETLVGRTIMQEQMEGFSPEREEKQLQPSKKESAPRQDRGERKEFKPRSDKKPWEKDDRGEKKPWDKEKKPWDKNDRGEKKPWDKDKKPFDKRERGDSKPWDKKEKTESRYIGKDENGKAIFSGKSGERNHSYDGTPKGKPPRLTGKKISIKGMKKKD